MGSSELTVIQHKFMEYGIYQDCGTGRGYEIDGQLYNDGHRGHNKGDLKFLNPDLRGKNYMHRQKSGKITSGEPRKPREWFSRAYFASIIANNKEPTRNAVYLNLSMSKINQARFTSCDLRNSDVNDCKLASIAFENCELVESEFSHTPLRGIDLSDSHIGGIRLNLPDIRGAIVNTSQAMELTALLGITIKD